MRLRRPIAIVAAVCAVALVLEAGDGSADRAGGATARAWAIKVIVPGRAATAGSPVLVTPGDAHETGGVFAYPANGSVVTATSVDATVSATAGAGASATASAQVTSLSLFGGEITVAEAVGAARAVASAGEAAGETEATRLAGLVVLGRPVTATPNRQLALGDWGTAIALEQAAGRVDTPSPGHHDFAVALDVLLTAAHAGLPAGTELQIGYAEATAEAGQAAPLPAAPSSSPATAGSVPAAPGESSRSAVPRRPPTAQPALTAGPYVFPVYGDSSFVDTFGGVRGDVSGGWHHGDDIFAALGSPVLAAADGTVFAVGWNRVGGRRLWLRDDAGDEFYYAHLSGYSAFAVNGAIVQAGDVLGFVGNSGDAEGTPFHLHFEVHPVTLLRRGYDGAVDPTSYLLGWRRLQDIRAEASAGWTPPSHAARVPRPGAILLQSTDISTASGLDPASVARAVVSAAANESGGGGLERSGALQPTAEPVTRHVTR